MLKKENKPGLSGMGDNQWEAMFTGLFGTKGSVVSLAWSDSYGLEGYSLLHGKHTNVKRPSSVEDLKKMAKEYFEDCGNGVGSLEFMTSTTGEAYSIYCSSPVKGRGDIDDRYLVYRGPGCYGDYPSTLKFCVEEYRSGSDLRLETCSLPGGVTGYMPTPVMAQFEASKVADVLLQAHRQAWSRGGSAVDRRTLSAEDLAYMEGLAHSLGYYVTVPRFDRELGVPPVVSGEYAGDFQEAYNGDRNIDFSDKSYVKFYLVSLPELSLSSDVLMAVAMPPNSPTAYFYSCVNLISRGGATRVIGSVMSVRLSTEG